MPKGPSSLSMVGCSHHSTPLEVRERIALGPEALAQLTRSLKADPALSESFVLHTCNRLELYAAGGADGEAIARQLHTHLEAATGFSTEEAGQFVYQHGDVGALGHLFAVASGLDSQLLGETEILGQVKSAYAEANASKSVGPVLHRVLQKTFQAAKWTRTHTAISQGQVSLGNVAVDLAERIFGNLRQARTLVVGSGEIGREVARALASRGARQIAVTSRRLENARTLAEEVRGETIPFNAWSQKLQVIDIAIFATASPDALLTGASAEALLEQRGNAPLFLVDLAVPRDVSPEVAAFESVFLYNLQDLADIANRNRALREAEVERCREVLGERALQLWSKLGR